MKNKKSLSSYQKPTILQILPSLHSGGVERGTLEVTSFLREKGYNAIVASSGGGIVSALYQYGAKHVNLPLNSKNPITIIQNIKKIENLVKQNDVDLIHARSRAPAWSAYYAAKNLGIPFITTFHGTYGMNNFMKRFYNSIMVKGEVVIAVSNYIKQYIMHYYPHINESKIRVIHRGVNIEIFNLANIRKDKQENWRKKLSVDSKDFVILLPGRFSRWKGHNYCLEAVKLLPSDLNWKLVFLGDIKKNENYVNELRTKVNKMGLADKVIFADNTTDILHVYSISDLVLSCSTKAEAFGRTVIEAAAIGKTVIATNIGGPAETIKDGETGFLVSPEEPSDLTDKIIEYHNMSEVEKEKMSIRAMEHVKENFSSEIMLKKTIEIYNEIGNFSN